MNYRAEKSNLEADDDSSSYPMIGGNGPNSYSQNSDYQKQLLVSSEDTIRELIADHLVTGDRPGTFRIADFGCSVGPNTFLAVENVVLAVRNRCAELSMGAPHFQVFFNDLIGNDFNTLFRSLPASFCHHFVAAVPGSFHGRLLPEESLNYAHCSAALHWLSRVPEVVIDRSSAAWNGGRVHYSGGPEEVKRAYSDQYRADMEEFLSARAVELVPGGLMALVILGFPDGVIVSDSSIGGAFEIFGSCLYDMARAGKISEEKVDTFNLPFYYPYPSEVKSIIEMNGSFCIERMRLLPSPMTRKPDAQVLTSHFRALIGGLVEKHFGNEMDIGGELFSRHLERLRKSSILVEEKYWKESNYLVFLKRKG